MSLPKEPRQKMINIMYLVLTALLALNVSKQIVEAFVVVDQGLQNTNKNFYVQNQTIYAKFAKALEQDRVKTKPFMDQANRAKQYSDEMVKQIQDLKIMLVKKVDNKVFDQADTMLDHVDAKEDFTTPTGILIGEREDGTTGEAFKLKQAYNDYRKKMLGLLNIKVGDKQTISIKDSNSVNLGLLTPPTYSASEGEKLNWQVYNFGERPLVSDIVILTKMQNDVRNAEASLVTFLYNQISANDFKVSDFMAKVIPSSNYVLLGDSFKADIFPSAFSATQDPDVEIGSVDTVKKVLVGDGQKVRISTGIGKYAVRTDHEGPVTFSGVIKMKDPSGAFKQYPFKSSYIVAKAAVVISPTKMNVFYAGVDNPVEVSVPGVSDNDIRPALSGGSMSGSKGKYVVRVDESQAGKEVNVSVSATMPDGTKKSLPPQKFRIKRIPNAVTYVAGKTGDASMSKAQVGVLTKVEAHMDNFDFDLNVQVVSYDVTVGLNGLFQTTTNSGDRFTGSVMEMMKKVPRGGLILIQNVKARYPNGTVRVLQGMTIKVN